MTHVLLIKLMVKIITKCEDAMYFVIAVRARMQIRSQFGLKFLAYLFITYFQKLV